MIGIYKITNKINGKVYIGQSVDIKNRWNEHKRIVKNTTNQQALNRPLYKEMQLYGLDNFSFDIIEKCKIQQLNNKQIYWIKQYNSFFFDKNSNGYNLTRGGDIPFNICSEEEQKQMIELWNQGLTTTEIGTILQHDKTTIRVYLQSICSNYTTQEGKERGKNVRKLGKKVNQYTVDGIFVKQYPNGRIAAQENNIDYTTFKKVISGQFFQAHNFIFIHADANQEQELNKRFKLKQQSRAKNKNYHAVQQYDLTTGKTIMTFDSYTTAAKQLFYPAARRYIGDCCLGRRKQYQGYGWRNKND